METTKRIVGQSIDHDEFLQALAELPEATQNFELETRAGKKQNFIMEQFERFANSRNYQAFNFLIQNINLSNFQADEIIKIIDWCISLDMIELAFDLATRAKELYPEHGKIESAHKALTPPQIIGTRTPKTTGMEKSQKWFRDNASKHRGKWVAINNGKLLDEADSLKDLKIKIDEKHRNPSTVIEKIPSII